MLRSLLGIGALVSALLPVPQRAEAEGCVAIGLLAASCEEERPLTAMRPPVEDPAQTGVVGGAHPAAGDFLAGSLTDDPVALVVATLSKLCAGVDPHALRRATVAQIADLDGDGRADRIVRWGGTGCGSRAVVGCDADGCVHSFFLAMPDGRYRAVLTDRLARIAADGRGRVTLYRTGRNCPEETPCATALRFGAGGVVPID